MRRLLALLLASMTACASEEPPHDANAVDAGSYVACGRIGSEVDCFCVTGATGRGTCGASGAVTDCTCAPLPADTGTHADTSSDTSSMDAATDAGAEANRCTAGAPRLEWKGAAGCYDTKYAVACVFVSRSDGKLRCLPAVTTKAGGYTDPACVAGILTTYEKWPIPPYMTLDDGRALEIEVVDRPLADFWYASVIPDAGGDAGVCTWQRSAPFPYSVMGKTARVKQIVPDSFFVAAP